MIEYERFIKLTNEQKVKLMERYNARFHDKMKHDKFTINEDNIIVVRNEFGETFTRKLEELTCPDFWAPFQAYDYIEYLHWRLKGCCDEEAMCRAMCD